MGHTPEIPIADLFGVYRDHQRPCFDPTSCAAWTRYARQTEVRGLDVWLQREIGRRIL